MTALYVVGFYWINTNNVCKNVIVGQAIKVKDPWFGSQSSPKSDFTWDEIVRGRAFRRDFSKKLFGKEDVIVSAPAFSADPNIWPALPGNELHLVMSYPGGSGSMVYLRQFKIGRDLFLEILKAKGIEARIIGEPVMEVRPSFKMSAVLNNLIYILPIIFIVTSIAFISNKS